MKPVSKGFLSRPLKPVLTVLGVLAATVLLIAFALLMFLDANAYKPSVEAIASKALGMNVAVEGPLGFGVFPQLHLTFANVHVRKRGVEIALVQEGRMAIAFLPLLARELWFTNIDLNGVRIFIERGHDVAQNAGNDELPAASKEASPPLDLAKISFTRLSLAYADKPAGHAFVASQCEGELTDMRHPGGTTLLAHLSLAGHVACGEVRGANATIAALKFTVGAKDGVFDFNPITMTLFGGQAVASLRVDRSAEIPAVELHYALPAFQIESFFAALSPNKAVSGVMDFSATLSMRGRNRRELLRSAGGEMSLSGANLTLAHGDLDNELSNYASSQRFSLFDLSAFLFAGPIGLAVTKGYDFSRLSAQDGGSTPIRAVVSKWKVEKGIAHAVDVALSTKENRLALQGGLDFVDERYDQVEVALVDSKGCAEVRQKVRGTFNKPVVDPPNIVASIAGPLLSILRKAKDLLTGPDGKCDVFYRGGLAAPK